jgi:hypothetical protein
MALGGHSGSHIAKICFVGSDLARTRPMLDLVQILAVTLAAVALAPALAHALELPGKMRLSKDAYFAAPGSPLPASASRLR